jgi:SEC-C motif-containing protein
MRSRYSAFALRDVPYLLRTWHPHDRPEEAEVDLDPDQRWVRLDVVETTGGGPFDDEGTVTFEARWRSTASRDDGTPARGVLRERSRFVRTAAVGPGAGRRWLYLDGELA